MIMRETTLGEIFGGSSGEPNNAVGKTHLNPEDLDKICEHGEVEHMQRGDALLCAAKGYGIAPQVPIPVLGKGDFCVGTRASYATGHVNPDVSIDLCKMRKCPGYIAPDSRTSDG